MTDFPTIVYRTPGMHRAGGGATYNFKGVDDADALGLAIKTGWRLTLGEAVAGQRAQSVIQEVIEAQEAIDDVSPATRDELEQKAKELGIGFNARTSDTVLAQRIAGAI